MLINLQFSGSVLRKGGVLLFIQKFATFSIKSFLDCLDALHYIEDGYVVLSLFFGVCNLVFAVCRSLLCVVLSLCFGVSSSLLRVSCLCALVCLDLWCVYIFGVCVLSFCFGVPSALVCLVRWCA